MSHIVLFSLLEGISWRKKTNWIGNFDIIQDLVAFAGFNKAYRIPASFAGLDIELRWYLELDFGLFTETIYYVDKIRIKDVEPDVAFSDITLKFVLLSSKN